MLTSSPSVSYRHTQFAWAIVLPLVTITLIAGTALVLAPGATRLPFLLLGVLLLVAVLFGSLTIQVRGGWLECWFGPGLIRRRLRLADVRHAEPVRNRWYYGWGIRLTPHGWLWNVSGLAAVELTLAGGKKFRLGTDEPERLVAALRAALAGDGRG